MDLGSRAMHAMSEAARLRRAGAIRLARTEPTCGCTVSCVLLTRSDAHFRDRIPSYNPFSPTRDHFLRGAGHGAREAGEHHVRRLVSRLVGRVAEAQLLAQMADVVLHHLVLERQVNYDAGAAVQGLRTSGREGRDGCTGVEMLEAG